MRERFCFLISFFFLFFLPGIVYAQDISFGFKDSSNNDCTLVVNDTGAYIDVSQKNAKILFEDFDPSVHKYFLFWKDTYDLLFYYSDKPIKTKYIGNRYVFNLDESLKGYYYQAYSSRPFYGVQNSVGLSVSNFSEVPEKYPTFHSNTDIYDVDTGNLFFEANLVSKSLDFIVYEEKINFNNSGIVTSVDYKFCTSDNVNFYTNFYIDGDLTHIFQNNDDCLSLRVTSNSIFEFVGYNSDTDAEFKRFTYNLTKIGKIFDEETGDYILPYEFNFLLEKANLNNSKIVESYDYNVHLSNYNDYYVTYSYDGSNTDMVIPHKSFDGKNDTTDYKINFNVNCVVTFKVKSRSTKEVVEVQTLNISHIGQYFDGDTQEYIDKTNDDYYTNDYNYEDITSKDDYLANDENSFSFLTNWFETTFPIIWQLKKIHSMWDFDINSPHWTSSAYNGCTTIGYIYQPGGDLVYGKIPYCNFIPRISLDMWGVKIIDMEILDTYWYWKYRDIVFFWFKMTMSCYTLFKVMRILSSCF